MLHLVTSWIDYVGIVIFAIGALCIIASAFEKSTGWGVAIKTQAGACKAHRAAALISLMR